jgi:hypothetical protein
MTMQSFGYDFSLRGRLQARKAKKYDSSMNPTEAIH